MYFHLSISVGYSLPIPVTVSTRRWWRRGGAGETDGSAETAGETQRRVPHSQRCTGHLDRPLPLMVGEVNVHVHVQYIIYI